MKALPFSQNLPLTIVQFICYTFCAIEESNEKVNLPDAVSYVPSGFRPRRKASVGTSNRGAQSHGS